MSVGWMFFVSSVCFKPLDTPKFDRPLVCGRCVLLHRVRERERKRDPERVRESASERALRTFQEKQPAKPVRAVMLMSFYLWKFISVLNEYS